MRRRHLAYAFALVAVLFAAGQAADAAPDDPRVHHDMVVKLDPEKSAIEVTDTLTFPDGLKALPRSKDGGLTLMLHAGLELALLEGSTFELVALPADEELAKRFPPRRAYRLEPKADAGDKPVAKLHYAGTINHKVTQVSEEYARSFSQTPGTIEGAGVFLGGSSWWVPTFGNELMTFRLQVTLPEGWSAVSQGMQPKDAPKGTSTWVCEHPMDEIYLIANRFQTYRRGSGSVEAQVYLRAKDDNLAAKYLEVTAQYIEMYRKLLGPYPYAKFALIENFWETGYGMPSFTLLGPRVIRFPFILHSSYPHEILHNWWGNSVYVDWGTGNWCEGLTAYLADHLVKEGQGRGHEYRRDQLKGYRNYVNQGRDFPLTQFRSRHSAATQAVGYGKCLFVFHMLRRRIGDQAFARGLQRFYRQNTWKRASWQDVRVAFEDITKTDLKAWFDQWVERTGAPSLVASFAKDDQRPGGQQVTIMLKQMQEGPAYELDVPVQVTFTSSPTPRLHVVHMTSKAHVFTLADLEPDEEVARIDIDPMFDLFRRLDRSEIPPTLGEVFGAPKSLLLVPAEGDDPLAREWAEFAKGWARRGDVEVAVADPAKPLPTDRSVWILGGGNALRSAFATTLEAGGADVGVEKIRFGRSETPRADHSFVFTARHPGNSELAIGWIGASHGAALPGLARKLPHYGKYSYLAFQGDEPTNVVKGTWDATGSPLTLRIEATDLPRGTLPTRQPLARLAPVFDPARLKAHVDWLADPAREGRGAGSKGLDASADYIAKAFEKAGLKPAGDYGSWFQAFEMARKGEGDPYALKNVVGVLPGTDPKLAAHPVVIGAHYDHLGLGEPDVRTGNEGKVHPGADDNASGVAVLLELAELLGRTLKPRRSVVFVAFSGEEWGRKGSKHFAAGVRAAARRPYAMINMDAVGRLGEKKLMVLGAESASEWPHIAMGVGFTTGVESECISDGPAGSDHVSFHEIGVPAVQVFSGLHTDYHAPGDTPDKVDADGLVKVATFVRESAVYLAERDRPLEIHLPEPGAAKPAEEPAKAPKKAAPKKGRRVSLGTMPDFAYRGPGVRLGGIVPGSPAEAAGLAKGDVLVRFDGKPVKDLRGYTDLLYAKSPGDTVEIVYKRGDEERTTKATLKAR